MVYIVSFLQLFVGEKIRILLILVVISIFCRFGQVLGIGGGRFFI